MTFDLAAWARDAGIELRTPPMFPTGWQHDDPREDFGRIVTRTPRAVVRPTSVDALARAVAALAAAGIPFSARAVGFSSGGQVLTDGVVIDLRGLDRVLGDDPRAETVTAQGGATWLQLVDHLRPQGRRPRSVIANLHTTVGGTLAVGGFGDATHLDGLAIDHVTRMTIVTPRGAIREVGPDDDLFRYTLAGRGQLGFIAEVTLRTATRPWRLLGRVLTWPSVPAFVRDAAPIARDRLYDFVRARLSLMPDGAIGVMANVGRASDADPATDALPAAINPSTAGAAEAIDLYALLAADHRAAWRFACPALEFVLPLPRAMASWPVLLRAMVESGALRHMPLAPAIMVVPPGAALPLSPVPPDAPDGGLVIVLRPEGPPDAMRALVPALQRLGAGVMAEGARMYLMSIELDTPEFLAQQFGDALPRLRALKDELDPDRLMNRWLL